jgi:methionyl-tRNA formyltransferase
LSVRAVVFGYREVGHRCLAALLEAGVEVRLVFTNRDDPNEKRWFDSVADLAANRGIPVETGDPNTSEMLQKIRAAAPDYIFSFYYRALLSEAVLGTARLAALNMHGSLLPKYRGRAPANWAILNGETETGATLHVMERRADAGPIIDQQAVAIDINDTALAVSWKIADAAVVILKRNLPALARGRPPGRPQDLSLGAYFGGRKPEDGRIDWSKPALSIHNLIRAVAPPFPGALTSVGGREFVIAGSFWTGESVRDSRQAPRIYVESAELWADCSDGLRFRITDLREGDQSMSAEQFQREFGPAVKISKRVKDT